MQSPIRGRSLVSLADYSPQEIRYILDLSHQVKKEKKDGKRQSRFAGMSLAMIFEKRSTRTRCAFETAFGEEGGHPVFLSTQDIQLGSKESIEDTARVLGRMFDAIQFRGFQQEAVLTLARYAGVPVYNGLTDVDHPTQVLADLMTLEEEFGRLEGLTLVFVGDGRNNVARALAIGCAKMGVNFSIVSPPSLFPDQDLLDACRDFSRVSGAQIRLTQEIGQELAGADGVYTDIWVSMGEEAKSDERVKLLRPYQVDPSLMEKTRRGDSIFLHCLPAVRGNEVSTEVIEGPASRVWDQAENRKHTIKALMLATL